MMRKSMLIVIGALLVALSVANEAAARDIKLPAGRVLLIDRQDLLQIANRYGLTVRRLKMSPDEKTRLANLRSKGCGCAVAQDDADGFGSCMKRCLTGYGIPASVALACGGACLSAGGGNPVGIGICVACLGTEEYIVAGCAMYCAWSPYLGGGGGGRDIILKNLSGHRRTSTRT